MKPPFIKSRYESGLPWYAEFWASLFGYTYKMNWDAGGEFTQDLMPLFWFDLVKK